MDFLPTFLSQILKGKLLAIEMTIQIDPNDMSQFFSVVPA